MLVNILIFIAAGAFSVYVLYSACRKYIGHNPQAPSLWARVKAWWPGFVKRHIVDDDPYQDESHAATRYRDDYIDWNHPELDGYDWVAIDAICNPTPTMYTTRPWIEEEPRFWTNREDYEEVPPDAIVGPLPQWRDSLRHRPGK